MYIYIYKLEIEYFDDDFGCIVVNYTITPRILNERKSQTKNICFLVNISKMMMKIYSIDSLSLSLSLSLSRFESTTMLKSDHTRLNRFDNNIKMIYLI